MPARSTPNYAALSFPEPPVDRPYVLVNMVSSVDGKVTVEGTEKGIGTSVDQRLMRELRSTVDMVLNGAGTFRASGTNALIGIPKLEERRVRAGKPANPHAAVISRSGNLPLDASFFHDSRFKAFVYLSAGAPESKRAAIAGTGCTVILIPEATAVGAMLLHMRKHLNVRVLLVEGGPTLNGMLLRGGCVDEFFLTVGPTIIGSDNTLTAVREQRAPSLDGCIPLHLVSAVPNPETSEVYLRYRVVSA